MSPEITLEQALELVEFVYADNRWCVLDVKGSVGGNVCGDVCGHVRGTVGGSVCGNVDGNVRGNVYGNVCGDVCGNVGGTISGCKWQFIDTPLQKLKRLIQSDAPKDEILAALTDLDLND